MNARTRKQVSKLIRTYRRAIQDYTRKAAAPADPDLDMRVYRARAADTRLMLLGALEMLDTISAR